MAVKSRFGGLYCIWNLINRIIHFLSADNVYERAEIALHSGVCAPSIRLCATCLARLMPSKSRAFHFGSNRF